MTQNKSNQSADEAAQRNFKKALSDFDVYFKAGELAQAAVVLETAFSLSREPTQRRQLIEPYGQLVLSCALSIQSSALRCGNILPEHLDKMRFAQHCAQKIRKLASSCQNGIAEIISSVLNQNATLGVLCCSKHKERNRLGITSAAELDELLKCAAALAEESRNLFEESKDTADRKNRLQAARNAVSNAFYCIPRWLFAPDYAKAEVFCRHSAAILQQRSVLQTVDEKLAAAACSIEACTQALKSADKQKSRQLLSATHKLLLETR